MERIRRLELVRSVSEELARPDQRLAGEDLIQLLNEAFGPDGWYAQALNDRETFAYAAIHRIVKDAWESSLRFYDASMDVSPEDTMKTFFINIVRGIIKELARGVTGELKAILKKQWKRVVVKLIVIFIRLFEEARIRHINGLENVDSFELLQLACENVDVFLREEERESWATVVLRCIRRSLQCFSSVYRGFYGALDKAAESIINPIVYAGATCEIQACIDCHRPLFILHPPHR